MKIIVQSLAVVMIFSVFVAGCSSAIPIPPTMLIPDPPVVTTTPMLEIFTPDPLSLTITPETPSTYVPFTFNITLAITNLTCGDGSTVEHPYTFTYYGPGLNIDQLDTGNTTSGPYDPVTGIFSTGAFSTSSFTGTELYAGIITFDGSTIAVTGGTSYAPSGQCTITASFAGTTPVP